MEREKIGSFIDDEVVDKKDGSKDIKNEDIIFVEETDKEQIFKFVDSKEINKNEPTVSEESRKICTKILLS